nr:TPA_asm: RdRp [Cotesiavirus virgavi]
MKPIEAKLIKEAFSRKRGYCYVVWLHEAGFSIRQIIEARNLLGPRPPIKSFISYFLNFNFSANCQFSQFKIVNNFLLHVEFSSAKITFDQLYYVLVKNYLYFHIGADPSQPANLFNVGSDVILNLIRSTGSSPSEVYNKLLEAEIKDPRSRIGQILLDSTINEQRTRDESARLTSLNLPYKLNALDCNELQEAYPEIRLNFSHKVHHPHAKAAAVRQCEQTLCLWNVGYNTHGKTLRKEYDVACKDIGGNLRSHINRKRTDIHCCMPILSAQDAARAADTKQYIEDTLLRGKLAKNNVYANIFKDPVKKRLLFCEKKGQECSVKASMLTFIHSTYDMTRSDIANTMDIAGAHKAMGVIHFDPLILINKSGYIPEINMHWETEDKKIKFFFRNDSSFGYEHRIDTYLSITCQSIIQSDSGEMYIIQHVDKRLGSLLFKITKIVSNYVPKSNLFYNLWINEHIDKKMIEYYVLTPGHYPGHAHLNFKKIRLIMPKKLIDAGESYAYSQTQQKFSVNAIYEYLRSLNHRVIVNGTDVQTPSPEPPEKLLQAAGAIFCHAFVKRHDSSQVVKAVTAAIEEERDRNNEGLLKRSVSFLCRTVSNFLSRQITGSDPEHPIGFLDDKNDLPLVTKLYVWMAKPNLFNVKIEDAVRFLPVSTIIPTIINYGIEKQVIPTGNDLYEFDNYVPDIESMLVSPAIHDLYDVDSDSITIDQNTPIHEHEARLKQIERTTPTQDCLETRGRRDSIISNRCESRLSNHSEEEVLMEYTIKDCCNCRLTVVDVPADGDCLYHCIIRLLDLKISVKEFKYNLLVSDVCQNISNNQSLVSKLTKKVFGDVAILNLAALVYNVEFCIHTVINSTEQVLQVGNSNDVHHLKLDTDKCHFQMLVRDESHVSQQFVNINCIDSRILSEFPCEQLIDFNDIFKFINSNVARVNCDRNHNQFSDGTFELPEAHAFSEIFDPIDFGSEILELNGSPGAFIEYLNLSKNITTIDAVSDRSYIDSLVVNSFTESNVKNFSPKKRYSVVHLRVSEDVSELYDTAIFALKEKGTLIMSVDNYFLLPTPVINDIKSKFATVSVIKAKTSDVFTPSVIIFAEDFFASNTNFLNNAGTQIVNNINEILDKHYTNVSVEGVFAEAITPAVATELIEPELVTVSLDTETLYDEECSVSNVSVGSTNTLDVISELSYESDDIIAIDVLRSSLSDVDKNIAKEMLYEFFANFSNYKYYQGFHYLAMACVVTNRRELFTRIAVTRCYEFLTDELRPFDVNVKFKEIFVSALFGSRFCLFLDVLDIYRSASYLEFLASYVNDNFDQQIIQAFVNIIKPKYDNCKNDEEAMLFLTKIKNSNMSPELLLTQIKELNVTSVERFFSGLVDTIDKWSTNTSDEVVSEKRVFSKYEKGIVTEVFENDTKTTYIMDLPVWKQKQKRVQPDYVEKLIECRRNSKLSKPDLPILKRVQTPTVFETQNVNKRPVSDVNNIDNVSLLQESFIPSYSLAYTPVVRLLSNYEGQKKLNVILKSMCDNSFYVQEEELFLNYQVVAEKLVFCIETLKNQLLKIRPEPLIVYVRNNNYSKLLTENNLVNLFPKSDQKTMNHRWVFEVSSRNTEAHSINLKFTSYIDKFVYKCEQTYESWESDERHCKEFAPKRRPITEPLDMMKNAMDEQREYWRVKELFIINKCSEKYKKIRLPLTAQDKKNLSTDPEAWGIIDSNTKRFIMEPVMRKEYEVVYDGSTFIRYQEFMKGTVKPKYNFVIVCNLLELMQDYRLYDSVKHIDTESFKGVEIEFRQGTPGCGKTTNFLNTWTSGDLVLFPTREAAKDFRERISKINNFEETELKKYFRTLDSYLLSDDVTEYNNIMIDEALMVHVGQILFTVIKSKGQKLIMIGDQNQIPFINRLPRCKVMYYSPLNFTSNIVHLSVSYRCTLTTAALLSPTYEKGMKSVNNVQNDFEFRVFRSFADITYDPNSQYLVFTQSEKLEFIKRRFLNCKTIHEYQGKQADSVVVIRTVPKALPLYDSKEHALVAISRHRKSFVYYSPVSTDAIGKYCKCASQLTSMQLKSFLFEVKGGGENRDFVLTEIPGHSFYNDNIYSCVEKYGFSDFKTKILTDTILSDEKFFTAPVEPVVYVNSSLTDILILQDFYDEVLPGNSIFDYLFDPEQVQHSDLEIALENTIYNPDYASDPKTIRFDKMRPKLRTSMPAPRPTTQRESLIALVKRNQAVPQISDISDDNELSDAMLKSFCTTYLDAADEALKIFKDNPITPNSSAITAWLEKQPTGTIDRIEQTSFLTERQLNSFNFMIKNQVKPQLDVNAPYVYSALQTIAYSEKDVNAIFCPIFQEMAKRMDNIMKTKYLINSAMSLEEFEEQMYNKYGDIEVENYCRLEIDFSKFDKSQGMAALLFECKLMRLFGTPEIFVDAWYNMHAKTILKERKQKIKCNIHTQRKSGDPRTYRGNTEYSMAVMALVLPYDMMRVIMALFSGDDSYLVVMNSQVNDFIGLCQSLFNLEVKVLPAYTVPYFCSKFMFKLTKYHFVPDPVKLITKLGRRDLVNSQHVEDYRVSLCDLTKSYGNLLIHDKLSHAVCERYKTTGNFSTAFTVLYNTIHNKELFHNLFYSLPTDNINNDPSRPDIFD